MSAIIAALFAAAGFTGASLFALLGRGLGPTSRSYGSAVAAGILLALAFADLFPEGLELAPETAVLGFVVGFSLLFLTELSTRAHTHHAPEEDVRKHALAPFVFGLAIHNLADGFVLGVGAKASAITSWLVGLGILVHQVPVGISLAAVFVAAHATGARVLTTAVSLGLAIPLAASATLALPTPGDGSLGLLTSLAAGVLAYVGSAHLLPEAQAEHSSRKVGLIFVATLVLTAAGLVYGPGE